MALRTYPLHGKEVTFAELLARATNAISSGGLRDRLAAGWEPADAITKPVMNALQVLALARKRSSYKPGRL